MKDSAEKALRDAVAGALAWFDSAIVRQFVEEAIEKWGEENPDDADRIAHEQDGEPDGCYYCGKAHKTSDCREVVASDVGYRAGYNYAAGYHD